MLSNVLALMTNFINGFMLSSTLLICPLVSKESILVISIPPLLFYIAEDVLSRGIINLLNSNSINLTKANKNCLVPSHTLFADNIMIFCRGDIKSLTTIAELLKDMGTALASSTMLPNPLYMLVACPMLGRIIWLTGFTIATPPSYTSVFQFL